MERKEEKPRRKKEEGEGRSESAWLEIWHLAAAFRPFDFDEGLF